MDTSQLDKLQNLASQLNIPMTQVMIALLEQAVCHRCGVSLAQVRQAVAKALISPIVPPVHSLFSEEEMDLFLHIEEETFDRFLADDVRHGTGSFYTSAATARYMVRASMVSHLVQHTSIPLAVLRGRFAEEEAWMAPWTTEDYRAILSAFQDITILDMACGDGAFLMVFHRELQAWFAHGHKSLSALEAGGYEPQYRIVGVDLQIFPLQVLLLKGYLQASCLEDLKHLTLRSANAILGDHLLDLAPVAQVMEAGGFDIVIGNPPYIGEKGNIDIFRGLRQHAFGKRYYEGKMDMSYYFTIRGLDLLAPTGVLTFLTTSYFVTADGASKYRRTLRERSDFLLMIPFREITLFKSARGQHNIIYQLRAKEAGGKRARPQVEIVNPDPQIELSESWGIWSGLMKPAAAYGHDHQVVDQDDVWTVEGTIALLENPAYLNTLRYIRDRAGQRVGDRFKIQQGIVSGLDRMTYKKAVRKLGQDRADALMGTSQAKADQTNADQTKADQTKIDQEPVFIYNSQEKAGFPGHLQAFYKNSDIRLYAPRRQSDWFIHYLDDQMEETDLMAKGVMAQLVKYKDLLEQRREVQLGRRKWFALQWPRTRDLFQGPKIVVPQRKSYNCFAYTEDPFHASADVYYIVPRGTVDKEEWMYLLGWLNSPLVYFWLYNFGKRKGPLLELYATPIGDIPYPEYEGLSWQKDIAKASEKLVKIARKTGTIKEAHMEDTWSAIIRGMDLDSKMTEDINGLLERKRRQ